MPTDAELALSALQRALAESLAANPHAPIHLGRASVFEGQSVQSLLMMRPCRCGAHVAQALFMSATPEGAMREATRFVKALVKSDDPA